MKIYFRLITCSYRLTGTAGVGEMWLTSACGWVCWGPRAAAIVRCFLCCFEFIQIALRPGNNPTFGCTKQGIFLVINYDVSEISYLVLAP